VREDKPHRQSEQQTKRQSDGQLHGSTSLVEPDDYAVIVPRPGVRGQEGGGWRYAGRSFVPLACPFDSRVDGAPRSIFSRERCHLRNGVMLHLAEEGRSWSGGAVHRLGGIGSIDAAIARGDDLDIRVIGHPHRRFEIEARAAAFSDERAAKVMPREAGEVRTLDDSAPRVGMHGAEDRSGGLAIAREPFKERGGDRATLIRAAALHQLGRYAPFVLREVDVRPLQPLDGAAAKAGLNERENVAMNAVAFHARGREEPRLFCGVDDADAFLLGPPCTDPLRRTPG